MLKKILKISTLILFSCNINNKNSNIYSKEPFFSFEEENISHKSKSNHNQKSNKSSYNQISNKLNFFNRRDLIKTITKYWLQNSYLEYQNIDFIKDIIAIYLYNLDDLDILFSYDKMKLACHFDADFTINDMPTKYNNSRFLLKIIDKPIPFINIINDENQLNSVLDVIKYLILKDNVIDLKTILNAIKGNLVDDDNILPLILNKRIKNKTLLTIALKKHNLNFFNILLKFGGSINNRSLNNEGVEKHILEEILMNLNRYKFHIKNTNITLSKKLNYLNLFKHDKCILNYVLSKDLNIVKDTSILSLALLLDNIEIFEKLLKKGFELNSKFDSNYYGKDKYLLEIALQENDVEFIDLLIKHNAKKICVNLNNQNFNIPIKTLEFLIDKNKKTTFYDDDFNEISVLDLVFNNLLLDKLNYKLQNMLALI